MIRISLHNLHAQAQTKSPETDHKQTQKILRGSALAYVHKITLTGWLSLSSNIGLTDQLLTGAYKDLTDLLKLVSLTRSSLELTDLTDLTDLLLTGAHRPH